MSRSQSMFFSFAEVQALEGRVLLSSASAASAEQLLSSSLLKQADTQSVSVSLKHNGASAKTAAAVKTADSVELVKKNVPIWKFTKFNGSSTLFKGALTDINSGKQSPCEISWMMKKIGFLFDVKSKANWGKTVQFNFNVFDNYTPGAKVQIWAGPDGKDKPVGKPFRINREGVFSVEMSSNVFKLGHNKITIVGTNVVVGYGSYTYTFLINRVSLTRTAWVVKPPLVNTITMRRDYHPGQVSQGDILSVGGTMTGTGSGPVRYEWYFMGDNDTRMEVSKVLTATMKNGVATIPTFTGLPTKNIDRYEFFITLTDQKLSIDEPRSFYQDSYYVVAATPNINIFSAPTLGNLGSVQGKVGGVGGKNDKYENVAVYLKKGDDWWTRPSSENPATKIGSTGIWSTSVILDSDDDSRGNEIRAYLLPKGTLPPVVAGGALPESLSAFLFTSFERNY